jgi:hypothetical protein
MIVNAAQAIFPRLFKNTIDAVDDPGFYSFYPSYFEKSGGNT